MKICSLNMQLGTQNMTRGGKNLIITDIKHEKKNHKHKNM